MGGPEGSGRLGSGGYGVERLGPASPPCHFSGPAWRM